MTTDSFKQTFTLNVGGGTDVTPSYSNPANFSAGLTVAKGQKVSVSNVSAVNAGPFTSSPFAIECGGKGNFTANSGGTITLKPGFHTKTGSTFDARIGL